MNEVNFTESQFAFALYDPKDLVSVERIKKDILKLGHFLKMDIDVIEPGEDFRTSISNAINKAFCVVVFLSNVSLNSEYIISTLAHATSSDRPIIPILLEKINFDRIPSQLKGRQLLIYNPASHKQNILSIVDSLAIFAKMRRSEILPLEVSFKSAGVMASQIRRSNQSQDDAVFIVHGHDKELLSEVEFYLKELNIKPIIMSRLRGGEQSLFQRFLRLGQAARFAVVLITGDDYGASRNQYENPEIAHTALQFEQDKTSFLNWVFFMES